jgi:hypothetical protein
MQEWVQLVSLALVGKLCMLHHETFLAMQTPIIPVLCRCGKLATLKHKILYSDKMVWNNFTSVIQFAPAANQNCNRRLAWLDTTWNYMLDNRCLNFLKNKILWGPAVPFILSSPIYNIKFKKHFHTSYHLVPKSFPIIQYWCAGIHMKDRLKTITRWVQNWSQ